MGFQNVTVEGIIARDPEVKLFGDKKKVTFSIPVNSRFKKDHTEWFRVEAWGQQAEFVERYMTKGRTAIVTGELETNEGTDGKRYTTLKANSIMPSGRKTESDSAEE